MRPPRPAWDLRTNQQRSDTDMKWAIAVILAVLPTLAMAKDPIPDSALRKQNELCIAKCTSVRPYAYCAETCGCLSNEMNHRWSAAEFKAREAKLSRNQDDPALRREVTEMARYCGMKSTQIAP
jgi:hypothetical protein